MREPPPAVTGGGVGVRQEKVASVDACIVSLQLSWFIPMLNSGPN